MDVSTPNYKQSECTEACSFNVSGLLALKSTQVIRTCPHAHGTSHVYTIKLRYLPGNFLGRWTRLKLQTRHATNSKTVAPTIKTIPVQATSVESSVTTLEKQPLVFVVLTTSSNDDYENIHKGVKKLISAHLFEFR
jgi:hypothetical protein